MTRLGFCAFIPNNNSQTIKSIGMKQTLKGHYDLSGEQWGWFRDEISEFVRQSKLGLVDRARDLESKIRSSRSRSELLAILQSTSRNELYGVLRNADYWWRQIGNNLNDFVDLIWHSGNSVLRRPSLRDITLPTPKQLIFDSSMLVFDDPGLNLTIDFERVGSRVFIHAQANEKLWERLQSALAFSVVCQSLSQMDWPAGTGGAMQVKSPPEHTFLAYKFGCGIAHDEFSPAMDELTTI